MQWCGRASWLTFKPGLWCSSRDEPNARPDVPPLPPILGQVESTPEAVAPRFIPVEAGETSRYKISLLCPSFAQTKGK